MKGGSPGPGNEGGGVSAIESEDGHFLYYSKYEQPGIWKMPLSGGDKLSLWTNLWVSDGLTGDLFGTEFTFLIEESAPRDNRLFRVCNPKENFHLQPE